MRNAKVFLAALLLLAPGVAWAQQAAQPKVKVEETTYSYYLISCGNFIRHRESGAPSDINNTADTFYVAGWISAYNRLKTNSIPEDTTLDDVMLWLEEYCTDNPLSNLETGLLELGREVKPRSASQPAPPKPDAPGPEPVRDEPAPQPAPAPAPAAPRTTVHVPVEGLRPMQY